MALFKILKGNKSTLPTTLNEGYMYITKDTGDIYVDISADNRLHLNANEAYKLRDDNNTPFSIGGLKNPVYFSNGIPTPCDAISTDHIYNTNDGLYPLLFTNTAGNTETTNRLSADAGLVNTIYVNPSVGSLYANQVWGAVWNDYAEFRITTEEIEPGRVVIENGDDTLSLSIERMQPGANIVSDTYGMAIGKTEDAQTPIAVSGRVLAYPLESKEQFRPGDAVCSGPRGTVSLMTREEIREYPERIIGTVSAIPEYENWGSCNVKVNGRIWIKVK